ncbi:RHS repeat-associated core domain-containing protein [Pedobacter polaris]|uniref:RHS repeat-associated core domain-containing protein n=1 Tax=Pedobacter polaris TaxID=2571273 RepID=UPI0026B90870|nr:RHS repeat-associated core domain-containing protein [Pedobacter polaris]
MRYSFDIYNGAVRKLQEDNYYAFGLRHSATAGTNNYLYNGKELQDELGQYDYGARFYDPVIGRWNSVDPLAEHSQSLNPYHFCSNNPMNRIDPDGKCDDPNCPHKGTRNTWISAALKENVNAPARRGNEAAANTFEVSLGVGLGVGASFKQGGVGVSAEVMGPNIGLNFSGKGSFLEGSLIKGGSADIAYGGVKAGVATPSIGTFSLSLDKPGDGLQLGYTNATNNAFSLTASSNTKVSAGLETGLGSSSEVSVSAKLGVVYGEVKANIAQMGEAVKNWSDATRNYFTNWFKETTNNTHK